MAPLRPVLNRILADIQERLTFRAQAFIKVRSGVQSSVTPASLHAAKSCSCLLRRVPSQHCNFACFRAVEQE